MAGENVEHVLEFEKGCGGGKGQLGWGWQWGVVARSWQSRQSAANFHAVPIRFLLAGGLNTGSEPHVESDRTFSHFYV
jgi:hypothetical protein